MWPVLRAYLVEFDGMVWFWFGDRNGHCDIQDHRNKSPLRPSFHLDARCFPTQSNSSAVVEEHESVKNGRPTRKSRKSFRRLFPKSQKRSDTQCPVNQMWPIALLQITEDDAQKAWCNVWLDSEVTNVKSDRKQIRPDKRVPEKARWLAGRLELLCLFKWLGAFMSWSGAVTF